jgi:DNA primase
MIDIEQLKRANLIQEVIKETGGFSLRGSGNYLKASEHDSLVVNTEQQLFFWNSRGFSGDVISWLEQTQGMDFQQATGWLARRCGLELHVDKETAQKMVAARQRADTLTLIMEFLMSRLAETAAAVEWAEGRGWDLPLLQEARCGYWHRRDRQKLVEHLGLYEIDVERPEVAAVIGYRGNITKWAKKWNVRPDARWIKEGEIPGFPSDMFIYGHWQGGRCAYISGRGVGEKRHHNPPVALVGERLPLWNHKVGHLNTMVCIVEGQADALTLARWHVPAVALAGVSANDQFLRQLERFDRIYLALDKDEAGIRAALPLAQALGPRTYIVQWPGGADIKDANDWLVKGDGSEAGVRDLLGTSPVLVVWMCQRAAAADSLRRDQAVDEAVAEIAKLPEYAYERYKKSCADALPSSIGIRELNNMVRALRKTSPNSSAHKMELTLANGFIEDHLFELVYDANDERGARTAFACRWPNGRISISTRIETENYRIYPLAPTEKVVQTGVIRLPSELGEYESDMALQQRIQKFIHQYVDLPQDIEKLASYYVMLSWLFDKFYVLPYLRARGDSDSGKSRFTEVVGELCMRAIFITGSTTPSPVFRTMQKWTGCTVVMDEADLPQSETSSDWLQMLNTGYKKGFGILRTSMANGEATVDVFSAFGPKILNMRGRFADDATESRCLTWETSSGRGIRADIERFIQDRDGYYAEARELRNSLLAFRLRRWGDVEPNYNADAMRDMPGRLVEITVPLLSITEEKEFKASIMEFVEKMNQKAIAMRSTTLAAKVLLGILRAHYVPDSAAQEQPDALRMQVAHITRQTNRVLNQENAAASLMEDEQRPQKEMSSGYVGKILSNELNLETEKASVGTRPMVLVWDESRIGALIVRYGYEEVVGELIQKQAELEAKAEEKAAADAKQKEINL